MIVANQKVSEHVYYSEVRCRCDRRGRRLCDGGHIRREVLDLFECIRARCSERLGRDCPIQILSGVRCRLHNILVGGASKSQHICGMALDLKTPEGIGVEEFYSICEEEVGDGGLGRYDWGAHIDVCTDPPRRRWIG
ncbi:MAG: peptidase M15 [Candidatus Omnitrophica bacterium]|nr:peptidase M15 [Candidatus Omnitrophota bacterium]